MEVTDQRVQRSESSLLHPRGQGHLSDNVNLFRLRFFLSIVSICHGCNVDAVDALLSSAAISNQFYLTHTKLHCR